MKAKQAFEKQIQAKPDSDTFMVMAVDEDDEGLLKFAVDYSDLNEFYSRVDKKYDCVKFVSESSALPVLKEK